MAGGGIELTSSTDRSITLVNSTISGNVSVSGGGSVSAAAAPVPASGAITDCASGSGTCSAWYATEPTASAVPLQASFGSMTAFMGWGGDCAGSTGAAATVSVDQATICSATFAAMTMSASAGPASYGAPVTLSATVTGNTPSGSVTFSEGGTTLCSASLDASGTASCSAGGLAVGSHSISASYPGDALNGSENARLTMQVEPGVQSISNFVASPPNPVFSVGGTFGLSATGGGSGNPVTFSSNTTSVCTVSGSIVTMLTAADCILVAHQAGNANWAAAPDVMLTVTLAAAAQTISFAAPPDTPLSDGSLSVDPTASSGLPVTLVSMTPVVCGVAGTGPFTVSMMEAGTCTLTASQAGDASYTAATPVTVSFQVTQALAPPVPVPTLGRRALLALSLLLGLLGASVRGRRRRT
ncbi:MAG TPA: Ig-like domain-containing protein [Rhodanobacteraceae bacterium]|nr:Ig-like domain-containing protein [Rhodanobacteraceae bacterium]